MECVPIARVVVENCVELAKVDVPSVVAPSKNVTVPVPVIGLPILIPTVAVKVTLCPYMEGLRLEMTIVPVGFPLTVCVSTDDVLDEKFVSPLYFAVSECAPTA